MVEDLNKPVGSESLQPEMEWPAERIIRVIESSINALRGFPFRIKQYFSMPNPGDKFLNSLDQPADKLPDSKASADSIQRLARMATFGGDSRFHTPYL